MLTRHPFRTFVVAAALAQVMTAAASAQSAQPVNGGSGRRIDIEQSVRLESDATQYYSQPKKLIKAARQLRKAAQLRPDEDRRGLRLLGRAGTLAYYAEDYRFARAALVEQAERALRVGEIGTAAHALLDAGFAAIQLNDVVAYDYVERARLLATSALLAPEERAILAKRMGAKPIDVVASGASGN